MSGAALQRIAPSRAQVPPTLLHPELLGADTSPRNERHGPFFAALRVWLLGYVALTAVMLGVGLVLTHALAGSVGRWDEDVNEWFVGQRTDGWNSITKFATAAFNTFPVIGLAAVVVAVLAFRRRFREAAFLVLALLLEIAVFLSVTFVVARDRPDVPRLNATPATSSFPSGHTAAATVMFVGLALIITCCTGNRLARGGAALIAAAVAFLVGLSRVYRGLHHPTDVFVGFLFGLACLGVAALAVRAASRRWERAHTPVSDASDRDIRVHPDPKQSRHLAAG